MALTESLVKGILFLPATCVRDKVTAKFTVVGLKHNQSIRQLREVKLQLIQCEMNTPSTFVGMYNVFQDIFRSAPAIDIAVGLATVWVLRLAVRATRKKSGTKLRGPKNPSLLFGVVEELFEKPDWGAALEGWSKEYGVAYEIPTFFGQKRVILWDPKATAYVLSRDSWAYAYARLPGVKASIARRMGKGLLWAQGESHQRQRRSIAPSFNSNAIRKLCPTIHRTVDKLKAAWEASIDANGGGSVVLDVEKWMDFTSDVRSL